MWERKLQQVEKDINRVKINSPDEMSRRRNPPGTERQFRIYNSSGLAQISHQ